MLNRLLLFHALACAVFTVVAPEYGVCGSFVKKSIWPINPVPVCWENPAAADPADLALIRKAVEDSWQANSRLEFSGWAPCLPESRGIRVKIADEGPHTIGLGNELDGKRDGITLNTTFINWSPSCMANPETKRRCLVGTAVHEFGHAIGFEHEQNRPDTPDECRHLQQGTDLGTPTSPWDPNSVMNFCNPKFNNDGQLSDFDKFSVQLVYGAKLWDLQPRARRSMVFLEAEGLLSDGSRWVNASTGFIVSNDGEVLTAAELVQPAPTVKLKTISIKAHIESRGAEPQTADLVKVDNELGLVLLKLPKLVAGDYQKVCASATGAPEIKQALYMASFPTGISYSTKLFKASWDGVSENWIAKTALSAGENGSAVFSDKGEVVGLIVNKGGTIGAAIVPISVAKTLFANITNCDIVKPLATPSLPEGVSACKNKAYDDLSHEEEFSTAGEVTVPSPGVRTEPNKRTDSVCFNAPPSSYILGQVYVVNLGSNGGRGHISAVDYREVDSSTKIACVTIETWTDPGPYSDPGWQKVELRGKLRYVPRAVDRAHIEQRCASQQ